LVHVESGLLAAVCASSVVAADNAAAVESRSSAFIVSP
jgi:hypothetical protein